jgi:hypothetical protein
MSYIDKQSGGQIETTPLAAPPSLSFIIDKSANMKYADQQISKCYMAATRNIHNLDFSVSKRIDLTIKLHATYARSAGMYASHIWSTPFINPFSNSSTYVESNHSSVMRFLLGVRRSTCRRSLLHEVGQMPFKFFWFRSVIRFWNHSIKSDNPLFFLMFLWPNVVMLIGLRTYSLPFLLLIFLLLFVLLAWMLLPLFLLPVVESYANCLNNFWSSLSIILRISDPMMPLTVDLGTLIGLKKTLSLLSLLIFP